MCEEPQKYANVVMMMGDLDILFNLLQAIGQHIESSGLDDVWVESGAFAKNSTYAMLEGKAYYRALRGHQLTYEAMYRIKWASFRQWVEGRIDLEDLDEQNMSMRELFRNKKTGFDEDIS